jgi:hypothetical protein
VHDENNLSEANKTKNSRAKFQVNDSDKDSFMDDTEQQESDEDSDANKKDESRSEQDDQVAKSIQQDDSDSDRTHKFSEADPQKEDHSSKGSEQDDHLATDAKEEVLDKKEHESDDEEQGLTKKGDQEEIDVDKLIDRPVMQFEDLSESDMSIFEFEDFNKKVEADHEDVVEDLFENQDTQFEISIDEDNEDQMISSGRASDASYKADLELGNYQYEKKQRMFRNQAIDVAEIEMDSVWKEIMIENNKKAKKEATRRKV